MGFVNRIFNIVRREGGEFMRIFPLRDFGSLCRNCRTGTIGIESFRMTNVADGADGEQVEVSGSDMDCSSCREWMTSQLPARE